MSKPVSMPRRNALKLLSGAPMLPLASSLASVSFVTEANAYGPPTHFEFGAMAAPTLADPAQMATTYVASTLTRKAGWHSATHALDYETFFLTGDTVPKTGGGTILAGGYYNIDNAPIIDATSPDNHQFFSDCPDGMSLLQVGYGYSHKFGHKRIFAVVQFEYTSRNTAGASMYGQLPSPIAILSLDQNKLTGKLSLVSYFNVDTSHAHGLWITCGASRSPWNTHLSSEEYEPDATTIASNTQFKAFSQNLFGDPSAAKPYHYGHLPEVFVRADGTGFIKKHYCLGRISHELVQVMPDERTVLMGDDATNGGLFLFVADRPRDLSAGTLYVAKWIQKTSANGGSADIKWIKLGHATSRQIEKYADTLTAADIVDVKTSDPADASYTKIPFSGKDNWVKFVPGKETAAAFLETHRYAAFKGGSLGFTKMEGTTVNARDKVAYSAISYVQTAMTNGSGGISIQGPQAGMVYAWKLRGRQKDDTGAWIRSDWVPTSGAPVPALIGEDLASPDALGNTSNQDKISNPDNLKFSEGMRTLFIGEDSGRHVNNFLWAYNVDTKKLSRILSCPSGAESTGLHAVDDVNGFTYIMSNFQHPGDWESPLHDIVKPVLDPLVRANYKDRAAAAVGYLTDAGPKKNAV
ncbi:MAG: PhoX family protein [Candidatus Eiseniibacteriota bacterium]